MNNDIQHTTNYESSLFSISFEDKATLYRQYMPFIQNGGLFIHTQEKFSLGDTIALLVQLPGDSNQHNISGRVVWITPESAQRGLPVGIGVQFTADNASPLRHKVEGYLADMLDSTHLTDTL
jgi:type IV pilus assembly protein PilZ